ncbi:hypothetical protein HDR61_02450 [bacterium]|nr:hypothetical protein [bacterium]
MVSMLERNKNTKIQKKTRADYAEDALYREVWEEVNNEKTQRFIKKYYRYIIGATAAILIVAAGVQIGVRMHNNAKNAIAVNYETAIENADAAALNSIGTQNGGAMADLALFQAYMIDNDIEKIKYLGEHGHTRDYRDLARLHVVGRTGDEMTAADVEKYLKPLNTKSSPYYYMGMLTVAQKYLADGDRAAANKWLDKITTDTDAPATISASAAALR